MIRIQQQPFDVAEEAFRLKADRTDIGAIVSFIGCVRDISGSERVSAMSIEHYPGMTEAELGRIADEAADRWPLTGVSVIHRIGRLLPGDEIVLVITASAHRSAAFEGAGFIMDYLKTQAPFWKVEETQDEARWVESKASDDAATRRWDSVPRPADGSLP